MPVTINGSNTPTAGGITYGDGTTYAVTAAGTSGRPIVSGGAGAPTFRPYTLPASDGSANQVLQTDGAGALSFATVSSGFTFGTVVTPTPGTVTDVDITGIPATAKIINIIFSGVSVAAGTVYYIQIGDSGGFESTGYAAATSQIFASTVESNYSATRFPIALGTSIPAASTTSGTIQLINLTGNTWVASGTFGAYNASSGVQTITTGGNKTLSATLDRIRIGASDYFDAGSFNIAYI
jgi:hypothetical protein